MVMGIYESYFCSKKPGKEVKNFSWNDLTTKEKKVDYKEPDTVYRVEFEGGGMYTGKANLNCYDDYRKKMEDLHDKHPLPSDKMSKICIEDEWIFGFESLKALYTWVDDSRVIKYLRENGYKISKYIVQGKSVYKDDERQLIFNRGSALKVNELPLVTYGPAAYV